MKKCAECGYDLEIYFITPDGEFICASHSCCYNWFKDRCEIVRENRKEND